MTAQPYRILIVDDEIVIRELMTDILADEGFEVEAAPNGRVAWLQIGGGIAVAAVLAALLVVLQGRRRVHAAGIVGGIAAAASLGSLPVFWHGVVISAIPATTARLACGHSDRQSGSRPRSIGWPPAGRSPPPRGGARLGAQAARGNLRVLRGDRVGDILGG